MSKPITTKDSDFATKQDLQSLEGRIDVRFEKIDKRFDEMLAIFSDFANNVNGRFDAIEVRLSKHDEEFRKLNKKYDHLVETIDDFIGRINNYEMELAAHKSKIDRLERWIEELAKSTGTKLSN